MSYPRLDGKNGLLANAINRGILTTFLHPVEYAKYLIQIGYEPLPPEYSKTIFRQPALFLPNICRYISFIKKVDGTSGCFNGLSAKLCGSIISGFSYDIAKGVPFEKDIKSLLDVYEQDSETERREKYTQNFIKDVVASTISVFVRHPFEVVAGRMMAEFIGKETKHRTLISAVREVYRQNGFSGFYFGVIPRLIGDLLALCIISGCSYLIHVYFTDDREFLNYCQVIVRFFASSVTYPFHIVSHCMLISSSGLKAGSPPHMPEYKSWWHCWRHLRSTNQIKRGSTMFWRQYTAPIIIADG